MQKAQVHTVFSVCCITFVNLFLKFFGFSEGKLGDLISLELTLKALKYEKLLKLFEHNWTFTKSFFLIIMAMKEYKKFQKL